MKVSWEQVAAWRARRHRLHERAPRTDALRVADELCGLHAQVMSSAELTLWARVAGLEPDAVAKALWEERTLVKTWAMRGTLHLLPSDDFAMWQAAVAPLVERVSKPAWTRAFGVTPDEVDLIVEAIGEALDGEQLMRAELAEEVAKIARSKPLAEKLTESWGALLKPAAWRGKLVFAPGEGNKVRFTNPASWIGHDGSGPEPDAAMAEVARRYLRVHGPATREDFARWWGVQPAPGGRVLKGLGDELTQVEVGGAPMYALAEDAEDLVAAEPVDSVRLLPGFDQYVIAATRHCTELMPGDHKDAVYRPQGWISPVLLVHGRMDGIWGYERKGKRLAVTIEPWTKLSKRVRAEATAEAERLAAFTGGELELAFAV